MSQSRDETKGERANAYPAVGVARSSGLGTSDVAFDVVPVAVVTDVPGDGVVLRGCASGTSVAAVAVGSERDWNEGRNGDNGEDLREMHGFGLIELGGKWKRTKFGEVMVAMKKVGEDE